DIAKFIAKADTDSAVIKKLLDERTGVPTMIN
ncbi:MAG: L,D-transpeptidase, partial [Shewanella sp.]